MDRYFQYDDLPQIPLLTEDQSFFCEDFGQSHSTGHPTHQSSHHYREGIDYNGPAHYGASNMQPMQRFLNGMDPSPLAPGLLHANLNRTRDPRRQNVLQYERPWPSSEVMTYSPRDGSPDGQSTSETSSHAPQNELCSPHPNMAAFDSSVGFAHHRFSYPSPDVLNDGAYSAELTLPGNSINLRDLELHHEDPDQMVDGPEHADTKTDYGYRQEAASLAEADAPTEIATENYKVYVDPGIDTAMPYAEEVQPMTQSEESDSDYKPSSPRSKARRKSSSSRSPVKQSQRRRYPKGLTGSTQSNSTRVDKRSRNSISSTNSKSPTGSSGNDDSTQRPFPCPFAGYGCQSEFVSKNEWKRHVSTQHIKLGFWRCDLCPTTVDPNDDQTVYHNDFNRKDLFTQHLRRMHAASGPVNRSANKQREYPVNEDNLADHQQRCYQSLRSTPPQSACLFCDRVFVGPSSWEERMEHLGRHLEKDRKTITLDSASWNQDPALEQWLLAEGLIARDRSGKWKIGTGKPRRDSAHNNGEDSDDD